MAEYYRRGNRYWISYQDNGKRIRKPLRTTEGRPVKEEKLARYLTNEFDNRVSRGDVLPNFTASAREILDLYRKHYQGVVAPRVIVNNCGAIERFLDKSNPINVNSIDERMLRRYLDGRLQGGEIVNLTANHIIDYLRAYLNFAIKNNFIAQNKILGMAKYKVDIAPPNYLKKEEISYILASSKGETLYPAILTAIYTGMRLGEIRRLEWSDFNFETGNITILISKAGKFRTIPIHPALRVLKESDLPFNFANNIRVFKRIKKRAQLQKLGWHTFRHTFITHLILNGVDLPTVQKLAGHSSIETTMIYTHVCQDHARESIAKINFCDEIVTCETL